jgi:hypothetical protein
MIVSRGFAMSNAVMKISRAGRSTHSVEFRIPQSSFTNDIVGHLLRIAVEDSSLR